MEDTQEDEDTSLVDHNNDGEQTEETKKKKAKPFWKRVKSALLSFKDYQTSKDVRILDRRLGYIYYGTLTAIIIYLVVVVFIINKDYLDNEKAEGSVYSILLGVAYSAGTNSYVWDVPEENPWGQETSAVFVPSKIIITRRQIYGLCVDPLLYCENDADCSTIDLPNVIEVKQCNETTEGTKGCLSWKWCPPENSVSSVVYYLENAAQQVIWTRMKVEFNRLSTFTINTLGSKEMVKYPEPGSNAWETNDIALMAGFNFSDVTEKGAVVQATLVYQCLANPTKECDTHLEVTRLDSVGSGGYSISYAEYYREGDIQYRDLYHMKGVRILFNSVGIYIASSLSKIVLQLASALGLIIAAHAITDGVMLNVLKEKSHFKQLKVKESGDFNEDD